MIKVMGFRGGQTWLKGQAQLHHTLSKLFHFSKLLILYGPAALASCGAY